MILYSSSFQQKWFCFTIVFQGCWSRRSSKNSWECTIGFWCIFAMCTHKERIARPNFGDLYRMCSCTNVSLFKYQYYVQWQEKMNLASVICLMESFLWSLVTQLANLLNRKRKCDVIKLPKEKKLKSNFSLNILSIITLKRCINISLNPI